MQLWSIHAFQFESKTVEYLHRNNLDSFINYNFD